MTSTLVPATGTLLASAAAAAGRSLTIGEPVTSTDLSADADFAAAVTFSFAGSATGEFAIFVDEHVLTALTQDGRADLTAAIAPAVEAVAEALGTITPGLPQIVDPRLARNRLETFADHGTLALRGATAVRAAVGIGLEPAAAAPATAPGAAFERLDLLRGVEMQASAELGRARMTVNELLNLRAGAVVELDRAAGDPADLYVNGRLMARGEVVVVDENYALRITQIVVDEAPR